MYYQPTDENSLRHLFTAGKDMVKISYLGQVPNGHGYDDSPDCLVLDKRSKDKYTVKRCEFKYSPSNVAAFKDNGKFDLAVVWDLPPGVNKDVLREELKDKHGCMEIIVLKESQEFGKLEPYPKAVEEIEKQQGLEKNSEFIDMMLDCPLYTVHAAYIAANRPNKIRLDKVMDYLSEKFPEIQRMKPKGRSNAFTSLFQLKIIRKKHGRYYEWAGYIPAESAAKEIEKLIQTRFDSTVPNLNGMDFE